MSESDREWSWISFKKRYSSNLENISKVLAFVLIAEAALEHIEGFEWIERIKFDLPTLIALGVVWLLAIFSFKGLLLWEQERANAAARAAR